MKSCTQLFEELGEQLSRSDNEQIIVNYGNLHEGQFCHVDRRLALIKNRPATVVASIL